MAFSSDVLVRYIGVFKDTLQDVRLCDMILYSGSWKDVFTFFSNELRLAKLHLAGLHGNTSGVSFEAVHRERPFIDEEWSRWEQLDKELLGSFLCVERHEINTILTLADGDGENISEWLSILASRYTLVDYREEDLVD